MADRGLLVEDFACWDETAFHKLYNHYYKALVNYAFQFVNDSATCEDLVQGLITLMWEKKIHVSSIYALDVFLYSSIRNRCLNYIKHKNVEQSYIQSTAVNADIYHIDEDEDELFNERVYHRLFTTIDMLPPRSREVFLMHIDGKSNHEIAEALNISMETVKTHKKRSMAFLREHLDIKTLSLLSFLF